MQDNEKRITFHLTTVESESHGGALGQGRKSKIIPKTVALHLLNKSSQLCHGQVHNGQ